MKISKKLAYTMLALTLLTMSFVFANLNSPSNVFSPGAEPQQATSEVWHSEESVSQVYLDMEDEPVEPGPIYMDSQLPIEMIDLKNPMTTYWHELYPGFSNQYHLSSWVDNGDGELSASDQIDMWDFQTGKIKWYHVEDVTITIWLRAKPPTPVPEMYLEYRGILPPNFKITDPLTTLWHEIWPLYSNEFHITSWVDQPDGYLSASDQIDIQDLVTGEVTWWHVEKVSIDIQLKQKWMPPEPPTQPITTYWHELYPQYSNRYHLSSWKDNGDGYLSASDQIDMTKDDVVSWYHVNRVTYTMWLSRKDIPAKVAIEFIGSYQQFPWHDPITTYWHEIYPQFSNKYHLSSWEDNGDGYLSPSDQVDMKDMRTGEIAYYHVDRITIDIILRRKIVNPISTLWTTLKPRFGRRYHVIDWRDTGRITSFFDVFDEIVVNEIDSFFDITYRIDAMTITLVVTDKQTREIKYIEFEGGYDQMDQALMNPMTTFWHEAYPIFSNRYHLESWDDNGDDILSPSDQIFLKDQQTGMGAWYHVDSIGHDIGVTRIPIKRHLHSLDPLETVHMDRTDEDITPIHLDAEAGIIDLTAPKTTYWHELYPTYSNRYHLSSWEDNGDQMLSASDQIDMTDQTTGKVDWYHVDRVTTTLFLSPKVEPITIYTTEPYDRTRPVSTIWYLNPSQTYHLSSWEDNLDGILSPSDQIDLEDQVTGKITWWHVDAISPDWMTLTLSPKATNPIAIESITSYDHLFPISSYWHEIWPQYSNKYHLSSWIDNGNRGLDPSDQIDLTDQMTGQITWWHVDRIATDIILTKKPTGDPISTRWHELYPTYSNNYHLSSWEDNGDQMLSASDQIDMKNDATGAVTWYHVERVTTTIFITEKIAPPPTQAALELAYPETLPSTNPVSTGWHEIYPRYSNKYNLTSWEDNGDGVLSASDQIDMMGPDGIIRWYHIDRISTDIILRPKVIDPITTYWHELYPEYSNEWHITSWQDNGDGRLSPSDQIDIKDISGAVSWYHVDDVTVTLQIIRKTVPQDSMYIDFTGGYSQMYDALTNPITTQWHEIYPTYSNNFHLSDWQDNGDGVLSPSDQIELVDATGSAWFHVDRISTDITITEKIEIHDVAVTNIWSCYGATLLGAGLKYKVNITVTNEGTTPETFTLQLYWNTTNLINQTSVSLLVSETKNVTLMWNTLGYTEYRVYKLRAYAIPVPAELDITDNDYYDSRWIRMTHIGDFDYNKKVEIKDLAAIARLYGTYWPQPQYNPNLDINNDGKIDIKDLALAAKNYGWVGPP